MSGQELSGLVYKKSPVQILENMAALVELRHNKRKDFPTTPPRFSFKGQRRTMEGRYRAGSQEWESLG